MQERSGKTFSMVMVVRLLALFLVVSGRGGWAQPGGLPPLTQCIQIRSLSHEQAARGHPVRLEGVVTFFNAPNAIMLADESAGIWTYLRQPIAPGLKMGDRLAVEGQTGEGHFAPVVFATRVTHLGFAPLPASEDLTGPAVRSGELDGRRVRVRGVVRGRMPVRSGDEHAAGVSARARVQR